MSKKDEIEKILQETLKSGTMGILSFEGKLCPVTVLSVTQHYIRISGAHHSDELFSGMQVTLELCSNRGCLVLQTEIMEVPESADEGILLVLPETQTNIFLRQFWRIPVNISAEIKPHAHPRRIKVLIKNMSAGGMLIAMEESLEVGESVEVFFSLKDMVTNKERLFRLVGSVTHVAITGETSQVSLKFVGMEPEDERQINEFVLKALKTSCPKLNF